MNKVLLSTLLAAVAATGNLFSQITIDNFDSYADTAALQADWGSFGGAASSGAAVLSEGEGVDGSNAALFFLNWDAGNNANMRMINVPAVAQDLSEAISVEVTLSIVTRDGYTSPTDPTTLKLAIQGGSNSTIWQTTATAAASLDTIGYTTVSFALNSTDMERVDGSGSFADTIAAITSIRLRFENSLESDVRQDVFVDDISAVTSVPEAHEYASFFALGGLLVVFIYRRRSRR